MSSPPTHALNTLNTFAVNAWAQRLETLKNSAQARELWQRQGTPELILGGGSNVLLVRQQLTNVWLNRIFERRVLMRNQNTVRLRVGAGENWDEVVAWSLAQGAYGLENLSLIPGCCGAAPIQNIGAYGVEIASFIHRVEALNMAQGEIHRLHANQCDFAYRHSMFRSAQGTQWLILALELNLSPNEHCRTDYPGIREVLDLWKTEPTQAQAVRRAVIHLRRSKLPDPKDLGNAGSFFKNPLVENSQAQSLIQHHPALPHWPQSNHKTKLSAAWLIDQCGFKGVRQGDAAVHQQHALVLVNHGCASGSEILALAQRIQKRVCQTFGIQLEPEPQIIV